MDNAETEKRGRGSAIANVVVNILFATFLFALGLTLTLVSYNCRGLKIIDKYYLAFVWGTVGAFVALLAAYFIFFALSKRAVYRLIFCIFICLDIFAALFFGLSVSGALSTVTNIPALRDYISGFGATAVFIFIAFQFLQVVILPVPGSVSVGVGVALFGSLRCSFFSLIGILLGSFAAFAIGRVVGYKAVCWIVGKEDLDNWLQKIKGKDYLLLSIMFLLPLFPDDVLCFIAGLSSMSLKYFAVMITITRTISVFTTSFSLQLIPFNTWWGILLWLCIFVAVGVIFFLVCKYSDRIDKFVKRVLRRKTQ